MKALDDALYSRLSGDATLGALLSATTAVYPDVAPTGADTPYVILSAQPADPKYTFGGLAFEWVEYVIKGVTGPTLDPNAGSTIASRIDVLLTDYALTVTGYTLMYARRVAGVRYVETGDANDNYYHIGGRYRFGVDPT